MNAAFVHHGKFAGIPTKIRVYRKNWVKRPHLSSNVRKYLSNNHCILFSVSVFFTGYSILLVLSVQRLTPKKMRRVVLQVLVNQILIAVPVIYMCHLARRGLMGQGGLGLRLPTPPRFVLDIVIQVLMEELFFYYSHRWERLQIPYFTLALSSWPSPVLFYASNWDRKLKEDSKIETAMRMLQKNVILKEMGNRTDIRYTLVEKES